jgi:Xaa-Pro aminopeptidase
MIVSNEPGYYKPGSFGIRIENLVAVVEKDTRQQFGGVKYLGMESLTMVSIV